MTPWHALILLIFWGAIVVAGYQLGKYKGHIADGIILTAVLGLLGLLIIALLPRTDAAKIAAAQRNGHTAGGGEKSWISVPASAATLGVGPAIARGVGAATE